MSEQTHRIEAILRAKLRVVMQGETYHGERDVITGAKISDASLREAAEAIAAGITPSEKP